MAVSIGVSEAITGIFGLIVGTLIKNTTGPSVSVLGERLRDRIFPTYNTGPITDKQLFSQAAELYAEIVEFVNYCKSKSQALLARFHEMNFDDHAKSIIDKFLEWN